MDILHHHQMSQSQFDYMPPSKRPVRETTVVHLTIEDVFADVQEVNVVMPAEAAAAIIESGLNLYRLVESFKSKYPALTGDRRVINCMEAMESSLRTGGIFIACNAASKEQDGGREEMK